MSHAVPPHFVCLVWIVRQVLTSKSDTQSVEEPHESFWKRVVRIPGFIPGGNGMSLMRHTMDGTSVHVSAPCRQSPTVGIKTGHGHAENK